MHTSETRKLSLRVGAAACLIMTAAALCAPDAAAQQAPPSVVAALTIKLMAFEKSLGGSAHDLTIYVLGAPAIADELKVGIGAGVGSAKLVNIQRGDGLPATKPSVLFVGNAAKAGEAIQYARTNKVLTVTGLPALVSKGVTLGIGLGDSGRPEITLNLSASAAEGLDWNPAIMKVAKTIK